jgi:hypothetical protein
MKDISELRKKLCSLYEGLDDGTISPKQAVEMNNTAGKIINSLRAQFDYAKIRGEVPLIPFAKYDTE